MRKKKLSWFLLSVLLIVAGFCIASGSLLLTKGVTYPGEKAVILIPTGSGYEATLDTLYANLIIKNKALFNAVARKKNYPSHVRSGRYIVDRKMSYIELLNMLRSGNQAPVKVTFNNFRTLWQLAGKVGGQIEADSAQIAAFFTDPARYEKDGFTRENVISIFIPNTYELYWNTSAEGFYSRMLKEYSRFWTRERLKKAETKNISQVEAAILASIIDDEVAKADEKPKIAGVYLNRLRRGMPLQACPTIKFALNDYTITRVLNKHLTVDSPYNTYRNKGFPPGPISCASIEGLEAVLNAEEHEYLFFAAKADFSGYHNFSRTLSEHNRYANEYQRELNRRKIYK